MKKNKNSSLHPLPNYSQTRAVNSNSEHQPVYDAIGRQVAQLGRLAVAKQ